MPFRYTIRLTIVLYLQPTCFIREHCLQFRPRVYRIRRQKGDMWQVSYWDDKRTVCHSKKKIDTATWRLEIVHPVSDYMTGVPTARLAHDMLYGKRRLPENNNS